MHIVSISFHSTDHIPRWLLVVCIYSLILDGIYGMVTTSKEGRVNWKNSVDCFVWDFVFKGEIVLRLLSVRRKVELFHIFFRFYILEN